MAEPMTVPPDAAVSPAQVVVDATAELLAQAAHVSDRFKLTEAQQSAALVLVLATMLHMNHPPELWPVVAEDVRRAVLDRLKSAVERSREVGDD